MHLHPSHLHATSRQARNGAPGGARVVAAPRGRMLPPARASGAARATDDPLAETACFGRAAPPGAPPQFAAATVDRRSRRTAPAAPSGSPPERRSFDEQALVLGPISLANPKGEISESPPGVRGGVLWVRLRPQSDLRAQQVLFLITRISIQTNCCSPSLIYLRGMPSWRSKSSI
jgi:hypothetical protein